MSIAYLVSQYPAPSHTFIRREVEALRARGIEIKTFSIRAPLPEEILSESDRHHYDRTWYLLPIKLPAFIASHARALLRQPTLYFKTLKLALSHRTPGFSLKPVYYFVEAIYLASELKRQKISHLHNHFAQAGAIVGLLASRYLGITWSFTVHGTSEFDGAAGALLDDKLARAEFVPCVSYFGRAQVMRMVHTDHWSKLFISRCGVNIDSIPVPIERHSEEIKILCIARLSPEKGLIGLLEAFSNVARMNKQTNLDIIGDGPDREVIEQKIKELDLEGRCRLLGRASESEVFKALSKTDIFVTSSFMEGLPVVLMEALAMKVPVVAPRVAGIPELVVDNETGLLFNPSDWSQLTERLLRLVGDETLRNSLSTEGRHRIEDEFDIKRAVEPLFEKFSQLYI